MVRYKWDKPNGRPEPISDWHLRNNFDPSIFECLLAPSSQPSRANGVDDIPSGLVTPDGAGSIWICRCTFSGRSEIQNIVIQKLLWRDIGGIEGQSRDDVQAFSIGEGVLGVTCCPVK
jgi:hypothetical protein